MILSHDVSAIDDNVFIHGRGFGGVSILWKNTLNAKVTPIVMSTNRVCAVSVCMDSFEFILFNVYMPCDNVTNIDEYTSVWNEIIDVCDKSHINNVVIGGDLNTCITRNNSPHTQYLLNLLNTEQLHICDNSELSQVDYTYLCPVNHSKHVIDHFIVNNGLTNAIKTYTSIHDGDNVSSHCPVKLVLDIGVTYLSTTDRCFIPRPKWSTVTDTVICQYKDTLNSLLNDICIPMDVLNCRDPLCAKRSEHCQSIQYFHDSIIDKCLISSELCIPHTTDKCNQPQNIAGWNDIVKPYKEASIFWHNVWKDCGSPRNAAVADVMRRARAQYHKVVKQVKRDQNIIQRDNMAHALLDDKGRSFWSEMRKINSKCNSIPNMVDGEIGDNNIADVFADKYQTLYNSVSYDSDNMNNLLDSLNTMIHDQASNIDGSYLVVPNIIDALHRVKPGKNDGYGMLYSDHFKHGPHRLFVLLTMLFNTMIVHGFTPDGFNISTIQPLAKNKRKSLNVSSNYRAIALSSPLSKIFDWVILHKNVDFLPNKILLTRVIHKGQPGSTQRPEPGRPRRAQRAGRLVPDTRTESQVEPVETP